jgi:23S rRNA pseudouridine1911/1915/1917 synthase
MRKTSYDVPPESKPVRLDSFVAQQCTLTRSYIQKLIREGMVTVNSIAEKNSHKVRSGDHVEILIPDRPESDLVPEDIPLDILWEDDHIIVINKPSNLVIYPAAGNRNGTLMNGLISICKNLSSVGAPLRPGVIHRLDKDTSGVIVIAKNDNAYYSIARQFKNREVKKEYLALLYGNLQEDKGEIKAAIGRSLSDRKKMSTRTRAGKEAVTRFEVVKRLGSATLAKIRIITGRTHQIRVHFASIGNPVLGDKVYGKKTSLKTGQTTFKFSRQMLHAYSLELKHPATGDMLEFNAPVPQDIENAIEAISQAKRDE